MSFVPSKLGTKQHWDEVYSREQKVNEETPEEEGVCWFDECNAENKIINFLEDWNTDNAIDAENVSVLDLGTGNGHLLFTLCEDGGYNPKLCCGIDYSAPAIDFSKALAKSLHPDCDSIEFKHVDFLNDFHWNNNKQWDLVLDKGTLDAIALSGSDGVSSFSSNDFQSIPGVKSYPIKVLDLVKKGGILLITSCNFTEEELIQVIVNGSDGQFVNIEKIKYPSFEFGGKKGQQLASIVFQRK